MPARFESNYRFQAYPPNKASSSSKGALDGAAACAAGGGGGGGAGVLFLLCLPIGVTVGAIQGASQGESDQLIEHGKIKAQRDLAKLEINKQVASAAYAYGKAMGLEMNYIEEPLEQVGASNLASYVDLRNVADSVIEFSVLPTAGITRGETGYSLSWISLLVKVRVISVNDGKEIDMLMIKDFENSHPVIHWISEDGNLIKGAFDRTADYIAEQAIDEILLIYYPKAAKKQQPYNGDVSEIELVPEYALRTIDPPTAGKTYWYKPFSVRHERHVVSSIQPYFRWEAWPRGFDIKPGNGPDNAQQVRYDIRVFHDEKIVYERREITDAQHILEVPLAPCESYHWSVRARFRLNGVPKQTEWTGAYQTKGAEIAPSWWRRGRGAPQLAELPNSPVRYYPAFNTPGIETSTCPVP